MSHKKQLLFDGGFLMLISYTLILELIIKKNAKLLEPPPFHLRFLIYVEYEIDMIFEKCRDHSQTSLKSRQHLA